jgi:2-keto-3-deoxy-L-rhamnonate aldolase RhmA
VIMKNATKAKLKAGKTAIGIRLDFTSSTIVESLTGLGLDFVYFDLEHGPSSVESCQDMFRAAEVAGLTPLVRVSSYDIGYTDRLLDSGAMGIIFPHCNTKKDAEAAVRAVKYPPEGERGAGGRPLTLSGMSITDYITHANRETMVVTMIEELEALDNLPEILTVEGLDVLWIGRVDLSVSAGIPGKLDDPKIQDAVKRIIAEGSAAGKVVGVGAVNSSRPDQIKEFINQGARFFSLDTTAILRSAARNILQNIGAE